MNRLKRFGVAVVHLLPVMFQVYALGLFITSPILLVMCIIMQIIENTITFPIWIIWLIMSAIVATPVFCVALNKSLKDHKEKSKEEKQEVTE